MFSFFSEMSAFCSQLTTLINWALDGAKLMIDGLAQSPVMGAVMDVLANAPAVFGTMVSIMIAGTVYRFIRGA